jgi:RNA polymerase sigma-70 factor (ECF subfamily)
MLTEVQQENFTRLWTESQPVVSQYIASLIADSWAARDILQGTSLALLRKFADFDDKRPFLPWALGVAKFEILGYRRDAARNRIIANSEFLDRYTETWAEVAPRLGDEASALRHCMGKLPARQRELVRLRYVEDLNSDEIAAQLSLTAANVRAILKRTRDVLRRCVQGQLRPEGGAA